MGLPAWKTPLRLNLSSIDVNVSVAGRSAAKPKLVHWSAVEIEELINCALAYWVSSWVLTAANRLAVPIGAHCAGPLPTLFATVPGVLQGVEGISAVPPR